MAQGSVIYFTFGTPKIMVSSKLTLGQATMYGMLTAIVTWISANFELRPDYNHPTIKLVVELERALRLGSPDR